MAAPPVRLIIQYDKTPDMIRRIPIEVELALDKGTALIEGAAKANAPIRTGALRASGYRITALYNDYAANVAQAESLNPDMQAEEPPNVAKGEAVVGFAAHYAGYVHDGTYRMAARPFLTEAAERYRDELMSLIAKAIEQAASGAQGTPSTSASAPGESVVAEGVASGE